MAEGLVPASVPPQPDRCIIAFRPGEHSAWELFMRDDPATAVSMFWQPGANLTGGASVMDFRNNERPVLREKTLPSAQNLVFATFHIDFYQLGYGPAACDEII